MRHEPPAPSNDLRVKATPPWVNRLRDVARQEPTPPPQSGVLHLASSIAEPGEYDQLSLVSNRVEFASRYVLCRTGRLLVAIGMDDVLEIRPAPRCTPLPASPPSIRGLANYRGEAICVLELAALLGRTAQEPWQQRMLAIRDHSCGQCVGLIVDEVLDLALLSGPEEGSADSNGASAPPFKGTCRFDGAAVRLLDTEALLATCRLATGWPRTGSR